MKSESKSAAKRLAVCLFLSLAGCADTPWPSWLTGEPDEAVLSSPRAVKRAAKAEEKPWPVLGDVPTAKPVFSPTADLAREAEDMQSDKLKARAEMERLRNVQMPKPIGEAEATDAPLVPEEEPASAKPFSALLPEERR